MKCINRGDIVRIIRNRGDHCFHPGALVEVARGSGFYYGMTYVELKGHNTDGTSCSQSVRADDFDVVVTRVEVDAPEPQTPLEVEHVVAVESPCITGPKQVGGSHYQMAIEPIDFIVMNDIPYREGNVIKYVVRHAKKNGAEDIKKAIHYLEMILEDYDR